MRAGLSISVGALVGIIVIIASLIPIQVSHSFSYAIALNPNPYTGDGYREGVYPSFPTAVLLVGSWGSTNGEMVTLTIGPPPGSGCPGPYPAYVSSGTAGSFSMHTTCSQMSFWANTTGDSPTTVFINGTYSQPLL